MLWPVVSLTLYWKGTIASSVKYLVRSNKKGGGNVLCAVRSDIACEDVYTVISNGVCTSAARA